MLTSDVEPAQSKTQPLITRRELRRFGRILVLFVLLAAAVNVPLAVLPIRSRTAPRPQRVVWRGADAGRPWPAPTPHAKSWPTPYYWEAMRAFAYREYNVHASGEAAGRDDFAMNVQRTGWPLPVLERKQMWWDGSDPSLKGPEPDPRMSLRPYGIMLNPLIVAAAAFGLLVGPRIAFMTIRRVRRRRRAECIMCGYPIRTPSLRCSECGSPVTPPIDIPLG